MKTETDKKVLLFAGTTEGRELAELLAENGIPTEVHVATEYGRIVMEEKESFPDKSVPKELTVRTGRLGKEEMEVLITSGAYCCVVDATHPYATLVSAQISAAAKCADLPRIRYARDTGSALRALSLSREEEETIHEVSSMAEAAQYLAQKQGNILVSTGSKEISTFVNGLCDNSAQGIKQTDRVFARVLPSEESFALCQKAGLFGHHIIAMQGPFSKEINVAMLHSVDAAFLLTKESGQNGGFAEKIQAALACGCETVLISNPEREKCLGKGEVLALLEKYTGRSIGMLTVTLAGIGMGSQGNMTQEVAEAVKKADVIFGAKRMLKSVEELIGNACTKPCYPYYLADEILPVLQAHPEFHDALVLFSGDTGFYSGARKMEQALTKEVALTKEQTLTQKQARIKVNILPGISSVSYLAARLHVSWEDAAICSVHGRPLQYLLNTQVISLVRSHARTFLLATSAEDVGELAKALRAAGLADTSIYAAQNLSYPEERIDVFSPADETACRFSNPASCSGALYTLLIQNPSPQERAVTPGIRDEDILRSKVPMTKEEVRMISVCKLHLTQRSIVLDIGSGTGSISLECARLSPLIRVFAVEEKEEAVALLHKNMEHFQLHNITVIHAKAPEGLNLPAEKEQYQKQQYQKETSAPVPTHAFIGGSGGNLRSILKKLYELNPSMRVVINLITLETLTEVMQCMKEDYPDTEPEIRNIQVAGAKILGQYHLMQAENPVYIISFTFNDLKIQTEPAEKGLL